MKKGLTKKIRAVGFVAMLALTPAAIYADENETTDFTSGDEGDITDLEDEVSSVAGDIGEVDTTTALEEEVEISEEEAELLADVDGAKLRYVQLKSKLSLRIENAQEILEYLIEIGAEVDIDELGGIIASMEDVMAEAEAYDTDDKSVDEVADFFVEKRAEVTLLSNEFRNIIREAGLTVETLDVLREIVESNRENYRDEYQEKKEELRRAYNARKIEYALGVFSYPEAEDLVEQVLNSEITIDDAREIVREHVVSLSPEQRQESAQQLREDRARYQVEKRERVQEIRAEYREVRQEERRQIRERITNRAQEIRVNLQNRFDNLDPQQQEQVRERLNELTPEQRRALIRVGVSGENIQFNAQRTRLGDTQQGGGSTQDDPDDSGGGTDRSNVVFLD